MAGRRKLDDDDVARLRRLADEGWSHPHLAATFGVSARHVARLVRGEQRAVIAGLDAGAVRSSGVHAAVETFLADRDLDAAEAPLAAIALAVAAKLDEAGASGSQAVAGAVPRLASELVDLLDRVGDSVQEPDALDLLRQRYNARRLALAAANGKAASGEADLA